MEGASGLILEQKQLKNNTEEYATRWEINEKSHATPTIVQVKHFDIAILVVSTINYLGLKGLHVSIQPIF